MGLCLQVCYAKELKEGFVEYTEQVVKLMVPLLKFYFHDDILYYAGHCLTAYYTHSWAR